MNITVYCASSLGDDARFQEAARELGTWIGKSGHTLVYGGSGVGLMGIVSNAVIEAGGTVTGVELRLFSDAGVAARNLTELLIVDTMDQRKEKMIEMGDAFVALPGGVGTLEEISEIFTRVRLDLGPHECYLLNIDGYYDPLIRLMESMIAHGFFDRCDMDRCFFAPSVHALVRLIEEHKDRPSVRCDGPLIAKMG